MVIVLLAEQVLAEQVFPSGQQKAPPLFLSLDGEIVCLAAEGRPQFYDLLRHRGDPVFYAFDLLWLDGEDLRPLPFD